MEQEFDKEIDALLRKLRPAETSPDAAAASMHLEADELAAFAENALPATKRQALTVHLADCGRCRKILSETVLMNAEAAPIAVAAAAAPAPVTVENYVPWYRRVLLFPNLAYVMGALVLVFSGFLGYVVLRDSATGESTVSQAVFDETPATSGADAAQPESVLSEGISANSAANAASNRPVVSGAAMPNSNSSAAKGYADAKREDAATGGAPLGAPILDGVSAAQPAPPPAATDMAATRDERARAELSKEKDDKSVIARTEAAKVAQEREESKLRTIPGPAAKKSAPVGPSRDMQSQFPNRAQNSYEQFPMKKAGGKKFELRDGVWYDTAYRGQATTNVRRGTEAFLRLDSKLRSIAESVGGTSVIMWSGKAYRIQ